MSDIRDQIRSTVEHWLDDLHLHEWDPDDVDRLADRILDAVREHGTPLIGAAERIDVRPSQDGQFYFVPVARNGEPGPTSETYPDEGTASQMAARWFPGVQIFARLDEEPT